MLPLLRKFRDPVLDGKYAFLSEQSCKVVDSPPFQRLRYLQQLGAAQFVYPSATHTRFAHSIGVAHRARGWLQKLAEAQPELGVTASDLLVVELAGLCHDLGHGPFSHSFEAHVVPRMAAAGELPAHLHNWTHERMSCTLFDLICAEYAVDLTDDERQRVKDLICSGHAPPLANWTDPAKGFMFDIVANKRSGLDVDRLDYLVRDNAVCAALTTADFTCLTENMRVVGGEVCFKVPPSTVAGVYHARSLMHEHVYHHVVLKGIEYMITDVLFEARHHLGIAEALADPLKYVLLDDTIVREIQRARTSDPGVLRAQKLLDCLTVRDIYKFCGAVEVPAEKAAAFEGATEEAVCACWNASTGVENGGASAAAGAGAALSSREGSAAAGIECCTPDAQGPTGGRVVLFPDDIRVTRLKIEWAKGWRNPVDEVGFWASEADERPLRNMQSKFQPASFASLEVRVYLRRLCETPQEKAAFMAAARAALAEWNARHVQAAHLRSPEKSHQTASARKRSASRAGPSEGLPSPAVLSQEVQQQVATGQLQGQEGGLGAEQGGGGSRGGGPASSGSGRKRRKELFAAD